MIISKYDQNVFKDFLFYFIFFVGAFEVYRHPLDVGLIPLEHHLRLNHKMLTGGFEPLH